MVTGAMVWSLEEADGAWLEEVGRFRVAVAGYGEFWGYWEKELGCIEGVRFGLWPAGTGDAF